MSIDWSVLPDDKRQEVLSLVGSIANSSSGNLHGFHSNVVESARKALILLGGVPEERGWYKKGEASRMPEAEYRLKRWMRPCPRCGLPYRDHCGPPEDRAAPNCEGFL